MGVTDDQDAFGIRARALALVRDMPELLQRAPTPGAAIAVVHGPEVVWAGAFGAKDRATGEPVTLDTVFEAASLSKPVFAAVVLRLCERGLLELDTPLSDYLPEPYLPDEPRLGRITARMVLCHTTGFPNWRRNGEPLRVEAEPGSRFGYSGEGYVYLQRIVERRTGRSLQKVAEAAVFAPLGMDAGSYVWRESYGPRAVKGHDRDGTPVPKWQPAEGNAATSLHTTAPDLARFLGGFLAPGPEGVRRHFDVASEAMLTAQVRIDKTLSWGLGWGLEHSAGGDAFWQWGDNSGFKNFAVGYRDTGLGIVVLTNGDDGLWLCREVVTRVARRPAPAFLAEDGPARLGLTVGRGRITGGG